MVTTLKEKISVEELLAQLAPYAGTVEPIPFDDSVFEEFTAAVSTCATCGGQLDRPDWVECNRCFFSA